MPRLMLKRKKGEVVTIGNDVRVHVVETSRGSVRLMIEAPAEVLVGRVDRREAAGFAGGGHVPRGKTGDTCPKPVV